MKVHAEDVSDQRVQVSGRLVADAPMCTMKACLGAPPRSVCCNGCSGSIALADDEEPLPLARLTCSGYDGVACCSVPADGRRVVATGRLRHRRPDDDVSEAVDWVLADVALCEPPDSDAPEIQPPPPLCLADCPHAVEKSWPLPKAAALAAFVGSVATFCRNGACTSGSLEGLFEARGAGACAARGRWVGLYPGETNKLPAVDLRLCDVDPNGTLVLRYDPSPEDPVRDGDQYRFSVRSTVGRVLLQWDEQVTYTRGPDRGDGSRCLSFRSGPIACDPGDRLGAFLRAEGDHSRPRPTSWCIPGTPTCRCVPGDPLCSCR